MPKPENLTSVPRTHMKKLGVMVHACNLIARGGIGGSLKFDSQPSLFGEFQGSERPVSQKPYGKTWNGT